MYCVVFSYVCSTSSDLDSQMKCLLRCMRLLHQLYKQTAPALCLDTYAACNGGKQQSKVFKVRSIVYFSRHRFSPMLNRTGRWLNGNMLARRSEERVSGKSLSCTFIYLLARLLSLQAHLLYL